ncbi:DUF2779 domain-containing protein [Chloroflexota bacterium]
MLTKTKYLNGLQCLKYLWTVFHEPEKIPEPNVATQYVFDQGNLVGELAKKLFPKGIEISTGNFMGNISNTMNLLKSRKPLFEAGIRVGNLYSRIDILNPASEEEWDIVEVKSSTNVKDVHISDVAYQRYCCSQLGLNIRKCSLVLINNQYVRDGEIEPKGFFNIHDITEQVEEASGGIQDRIDAIIEVISQETCPDIGIDKHCFKPYECMLKEICWEFLPEDSIFELRGGKIKQFSLYEQGILSIKDIPDGVLLSRQQQIQKECVLSGNTHIEQEEIQTFLDKLEYPLYYLDFETISPAIPIYDGMRPYQTIPFQFSLYIVDSDSSKPVHYAFLAEGKDDPRRQLLNKLQELVGFKGSIIAYNAGFEEGVLREIVEAFPEYSEWFEGILLRIVDLLYPFTNFHYYHPSQKDTASLKKVLPAITGKSYDEMGIGAGMDASMAYERITYSDVTQEEISSVRADLLEYCKLDTEGMIWIVDKLKEIAMS